MKLTTPKSYKLTPTRSGGGHVQVPSIVLQWAGWKAPCRVVFSVRGGKVSMEKEE
jgi:hypothetical protein